MEMKKTLKQNINKYKRGTLLILTGVVILALAIYGFYFMKKTEIIKINNKVIKVEIADNDMKRAMGFSGRENLPENQGMFFVYEKSDYYSYWMKDMKFPLDFIWIEKGKVVGLTENVSTSNYPPPKHLVPQEKVNAVLEVNAGFIKKNNIKVGDSVSF